MLTPKRLVAAGIGLVLILFGAWLARSAQDLAWPKFFVNHETFVNPTEETKAADLKKNGEGWTTNGDMKWPALPASQSGQRSSCSQSPARCGRGPRRLSGCRSSRLRS